MRRGPAVVLGAFGGVTPRRSRRAGRRVSLAGLACVAFLALAIPGALAAPQTFVVTTATDSLEVGNCDAHCTFREAISAANATPADADTIQFEIPGAGTHTILTAGSWPPITSPVTIDGTTEDDYSGTPLIEFDGGTNSFNGLFFGVDTGASAVRGLAINRWQTAVTTQAGVTLTLLGNYIGTLDGTTARPNGDGIVFLGGSNHVVGGAGEGQGNVVSGNTGVGIRFQDVAGATVYGNRIGTNAAGTAALGNGSSGLWSGVEIAPTTAGASGIVIGGSGAGQGNVISGSTRSGIDIYPSEGRTVDDTTIQGNRIGTNAAGTSAIANAWHGVHIRGFGVNGATTDTTIGGTAAGEGNTIAFNSRDGVAIDSNDPDPENLRNSIRGNSIHSNDTPFGINDLGIDLGPTDVTANDVLDADAGANGLQNFPVLDSVTTGGDQTIIEGSLNSTPDTLFDLDFYVNDACDPSGNGEGATFIGSAPAFTAGGSGDATFHVELLGEQTVGAFLTATATDPDGNTSEFSVCEAIEAAPTGPQPGPTFTVNTTADGGPGDVGCSTADCTLREAIEAANAQVGANDIHFDIAGAGPHTIMPDGALPSITGAVAIDATSEPDFSGSPMVVLDGTTVSSGAGGDGFHILAGPTTVRGLVINSFTGSGSDAIHIEGGNNNLIARNYIGTDVTGEEPSPNLIGIRIWTAGNTIGSTIAGEGNVISGNIATNILIAEDTADSNNVRGNYIGTDASGTAALDPSSGHGVVIEGSADDNFVGGIDQARNVISGNGGSGVRILDNETTGNTLDHNYVGLDVSGMLALGNGGAGVEIARPDAANTVHANTIADNAVGVIIGSNDTGTSGQVIQNNGIGVNVAAQVVGQDGPGIHINGTSAGDTSDNSINTNNIAGSGGAGILVEATEGGSATGNTIRFNNVHENDGLGIDLFPDEGVNLNDADDLDLGANGRQNYPGLGFATISESDTVIEGVLSSTPARNFLIDFYANGECDPSGFGEGHGHLASRIVTTNGGGDVEFAQGIGFSLEPGTQVTATATDQVTGDTSEFSECITAMAPEIVYTVNTNNDDSPDDCTEVHCTLREAIEAANGDGTPSRIVFNLAETDIFLAGQLPAITAPVVIDGTSQGPGTVSIDGEGTSEASGLALAPGSGGSFVEEIQVHDFAGAGVLIESDGNTVQGLQVSAVDRGIVLQDGAAGNVVGGVFAGGAGNRIWNFDSSAIHVESAGANNEIAGNTIGIDSTGAPQTVEPGSTGISVSETAGIVIGHDVAPNELHLVDGSRSNVIVRTTFGIFFESDVTGAIVAGNRVGVNRTGVAADLGVASTGIELSGASNNNQLGPGNTVAHNGTHGIRINHSQGNRIVANSIHSNGQLGISLNSGNGGIAAPALSNAIDNGGGAATVSGGIQGPSGNYVVEFFENASCDPSGNGEGAIYRGFTLVQITNGTSAAFVADTFPGVALGDVVTATLTRFSPPFDTSEFSNCETVVVEQAAPAAPVLFGAVADATPNEDAPAAAESLGVAGLVDSGVPQAGQLFDVEFYSVPACDAVGPTTLLGTGQDFVTNETGIAGFAKDGLTDVDPGTAVIAVAVRGGATSPRSNCVVADFNNTSWHTARTLAPNVPEPGEPGHLRASGEGRWFKVPVLPSSRVDIRLSGLPSDYDLIVFNDIQAAYDEILDGADPARGPNLAIDDLNKQGAETPVDAFNTSQYNPSSWDPTNWKPDLNTSLFSASQWSASQWSASQWSASQWSASQWSASQWSASQWSASQWSASQWSASQWSASQWSASQWSESNPAHPKTFADAQTRSLLAVSAGPGTGDESVSVNTWNNTGNFYIRVQGKNGSFDAGAPFTLQVARQGNVCEGLLDEPFAAPTIADTDRKTVILVDNSRLQLNQAQSNKLTQFANRTEVAGAVVNVSSFPALNTLNMRADGLRGCPMAKNLVASGIKKLVDAYRKSNPIEYVVVIGDDDVIPFFRYPDPALMANETMYTPPVRDETASQASLRLGYVLSDDFLASSDSVSQHGNKFPVPDIASGRLVETPGEIEGMLDAYLGLGPTANGVVPTPTSSLVTGYDFLQDAADEIGEHLAEGIGPGTHRRLVTEQTVSPATTTVGTTPDRNHSWTGEDLRRALLQSGRHDMIFLSGHFSANDALGADFRTNVLATELPASPVDLTNSIVFSAGCHAGYNIVNDHATEWTEPVDWAQAFARKRATLIAGTGYQYGDTDFLAHSERIYAEFARQLRLTHTTGVRVPVDVGGALLRSKQRFLKLTPGLTALDVKSLLQTTLFGFPMLSVDLPQGRFVDPRPDSIVDATAPVGPGPGADLGLKVKSVENLGASLTDPLPKNLTGLDVPATWLEGPDGVAVRPTQPILPLRSLDVTSPDPLSALRGVAFRGGSYKDAGGTTPLTAAPASELRGIHAPFFTDVFFPTQPWVANYFDALGGGSGSTFLHLTPVQHRSESPTMTRRAFDDLDLDLFYSGNVTSYCPDTGLPVPPGGCPTIDGRAVAAVTPALAAPPTITGVETSFANGALTFRARAVGDPFAGIQGVWVTWTIPPGVGSTGIWRSIDLVQDETDRTLWTGELVFDGVQGRPAPSANPGDVNFLVQAVNGVGRVTMDHNVGSFYRPGSIPGAGAPPGTPEATELEITVPPPPSVVYRDSFEVTVELTSGGQPVVGKLVRVGIGANGLPAVTDMLGRATVELQAALTPDPDPYIVNATFSGDVMHASSKDSALVEITKRDTTLVIGGSLTLAPSSVHAILTAVPSAPLDQRTVTLIFTGTGPANVGYKDVFPGKTDPTGRVEVTDEFLALLPAGNYRIDAYFNGVTLPDGSVLPPDSPEYEPATATANLVFRPSARSLLDQAVALLQPLAARPGSAGDKAEDALAKVQSAINKLSRNNRQGALGDLEGAAGDLQSGVNNRQLTNAQARPIQELITAAAWVTALEARDRAIARGGRPSKIAEANTAINQGNQRWAARAFKDAIARYKDAVAKAEGA